MPIDILSTAEELYSLPPDEFIATRNRRAKAARAEGDRELATRIADLVKPSAAAWAANMLVRHRSDQVDELIELGASLRSAQERLDPDRLRDLTRQRQKLIAALGAEARTVAEEVGKRPSDTAIDEVEQTLQAALADPDAALAVQSGRLIRTLTGTGWEPVDLSGAVAVPPKEFGSTREAEASGASAARPRTQSGTTKSAEAKKRESERREARRRAEEADQKADAARNDLEEIDRRLDDLSAQRDTLAKERDSLRDRITAVETESTELNRIRRDLKRDRKAAARVLERAEHEADTAHDRGGG